MHESIEAIVALFQDRAQAVRVRSVITEHLRAIVDGRCKCLPTQHVLGFVQARLGESGGRVVRLHIWPVPKLTPAKPAWLVHTHWWEITSHILCGTIVNHTYQVQSDTNGDFRLYEVRYASSGSRRVSTTEIVSCTESAAASYGAGEYYTVEQGAFHTSVVETDVFAATLIVTDPPRDEPPLVVGDRDGDQEYSYPQVSVDHARFVRLVENVLRQMTENGS